LGALVATASSGYIDSEIVPQPGDPVQLEVALPAHRGFGQRCLACEAIAVRATAEEGRCLVALQFERIEIRRVIVQFVAAGPVEVM
jgi:hypothetical protein